MRGDADARGLRHCRDLARFAESADMAQVGLGDVDRAQAEQVVKFAAIHQTLAGGDRHRRFIHDLLHAQGIAGLDRFLDEQRPVWRQRMDVLQRHAGRGAAAVEVDHDLDVVADGFAQCLHHAADVVQLLG